MKNAISQICMLTIFLVLFYLLSLYLDVPAQQAFLFFKVILLHMREMTLNDTY